MKRVILLFFTILVASMCKAEDFTYTISGNSATITKYNGSEKSVVFPKEITEGSNTYPATSIVGTRNTPVIPKSDVNVEELFIPAGITTIDYVTNDLSSLKTVVIEDGTKLAINNIAFYISQNFASLQSLDNIIVLSTCEATPKQLISSNYMNSLLKVGEIKVYYQGNIDGETVQMYLFNLGDGADKPFGATRFKYLLSAIQKRGTDISKITKIDLRKVPNNPKVYFAFDDNYNPSSELSSGAEVIISETESYTATNRETTIIDKENYIAPQYNILTNICYSRTNTYNWNSVCLPFDIKESYFVDSNNPNGYCKIYTVTAATNNQISLTRVETPESKVKAGTPCFIYSSKNDWDLNLSNVTISYNVAPETLVVDENWQVVGSFTNETIGTGKYKLNSSGTEFGITNNEAATVTAFRCYLKYIGSQGAPNRLSVNIDEEASITLVPNDAEPQKVKLYDLMGRPRKEGSQGIFIKSKR